MSTVFGPKWARTNVRLLALVSLALFVLVGSASAKKSPETSPAVTKVSDGIELSLTNGVLKLEVCAENIIRVAFATNAAFFNRRTPATEVRHDEKTKWTVKTEGGETMLATTSLQARVNLATGAVRFCDTNGETILAEQERSLTPANVQGEDVFQARQQWQANDNEALYGLGQHQLGLMNIKGFDLDLWQHNTSIAVPFLVSSRGYGILWDNLSYSRFGDLRAFEPIPGPQLLDARGRPGGLTGSYYKGAKFEELVGSRIDEKIDIHITGDETRPNELIHPALPATGDVTARWEGAILASETGDHLLQAFSCGGIKLWVDGRLVIDHWRQGWLPGEDLAKVHMEVGHRYRIKLEWSKDQGQSAMRLLWKTPAPEAGTSLWSQVADGIDYYFIHGTNLDEVVAGYRQLTGPAPMMPLWAYGFWQSRERYQSGQEVLNVLDEFRNRNIPLDNIVQDWRYWKFDGWGSHELDPDRYPHAASWINSIHDKYHAHLMISVWGKFYTNTANFDALQARGFIYPGTLQRGLKDWLGFPYAYYDALNPEAGKLFWSQINHELFSKGVDAWWLDATEPELESQPTPDSLAELMNTNALGTGARSLNVYPLMNSRAVYEGQRQAAPDQRVFILTRSSFAGQQRYAAAAWSGDISSTWTALRRQVPAGLSFALSGMPYWTTDIGGFAVPNQWNRGTMSAADREEWRELQTRWFEYGTFCPLFRSHGESPAREPWNLAPPDHPAYQALVKFDRLRYHLMPYLYSLGAEVTRAGSTIMRPLTMDFGADTNVWETGDAFMFGPAILVNPVTEYRARFRSVYLPVTKGGWYDFWTGDASDGGQTLKVAAPYDSLPLYVKAGSIIPTGPELEYTGQHPADPITIFVYAGADGAFTLYEDDGLTYGYEHEQFVTIPLQWNDAKKTLTIGKREGAFKGMLKTRTFKLVLVSDETPKGFAFDVVPAKAVKYNGKQLNVVLP